MPLSLCTKVMQLLYYFGNNNVVCNDTLLAKRYIKNFPKNPIFSEQKYSVSNLSIE